MREFIRKPWLIVCLALILVITSFPWPGPQRANAQLPTAVDELVGDWLPQPGVNNTNSPFQFGAQGGAGTAGMPDIPSLGQADPTAQSAGGMPIDPVSLPSGSLILNQDDMVIDAPGFPITLQRMYLSERKANDGAFGFGWMFPYAHKLQMFADFNIVEQRPDGSEIRYTFYPANANQYVDSFDGDSMIYYNLNQGTYISDEPYGSKLERLSQNEYKLTTPEGITYTFKGYDAVWREQSKDAGKLLAVQDRNGNTVSLSYDSQGRLTVVTDSVGRALTLEYTGDRVSAIVDVLDRRTVYAYDAAGNLSSVTRPDGLVWTYTYDNEHRLTSTTRPDTGVEAFVYSGDRVIRYTKANSLITNMNTVRMRT